MVHLENRTRCSHAMVEQIAQRLPHALQPPDGSAPDVQALQILLRQLHDQIEYSRQDLEVAQDLMATLHASCWTMVTQRVSASQLSAATLRDLRVTTSDDPLFLPVELQPDPFANALACLAIAQDELVVCAAIAVPLLFMCFLDHMAPFGESHVQAALIHRNSMYDRIAGIQSHHQGVISGLTQAYTTAMAAAQPILAEEEVDENTIDTLET
jgi:hypothetical protein